MNDLPHGFVLFGASEDLDHLLELNGSRLVIRVLRSSPIEESEGLSAGVRAGAKNAEDELGVDGDLELVEGSLHVEISPDDVGDVVYGGEVVIFGGRIGGAACGSG